MCRSGSRRSVCQVRREGLEGMYVSNYFVNIDKFGRSVGKPNR